MPDPTLPGFLNGGQRPNNEQAFSAGAGFGPSNSLDQPKLQVVAPLDVNAAPSQAEALAKALNVGWSLAQPQLNKDLERRGQQDASLGSADAALNQIDPVKMAKVDGYRIGATRTVTEQHTLAALNEASQKMQTDWQTLPLHDTNTAGNGAISTQKGLLSNLDDFFRSRLGGLDKDPEAARVIAPMIQHFMNEAAGQRVERDIKMTQQNAEDTAQALAMHAAHANDGSFTWDEQFKKMTQVYGGDKRAASQALVHSLGEAAVQARNPGLIDLFLPAKTKLEDGQEIDGPGQTPANAAYLDEARSRARVLMDQDNKKVIQSSETGIMDRVLSGQDPRAMLHQYAGMPGADPHFLESAFNWYRELTKAHTEDELDTGAASSVIAGVAKGDITSANQVLQAVTEAHITGKAKSQLIDKALTTLRTVQTTDVDDPAFRAGQQYIDSQYKPGINPLTGKFQNPAAANQHAGILLDYRTEVAKQIKNGTGPEEAANNALTTVQQKWGQPIESADMKVHNNGPAPATDLDQATVIKNAPGNPKAFYNSRVNAGDIKRLRDLNMISDTEAATAAQLVIDRHNKR